MISSQLYVEYEGTMGRGVKQCLDMVYDNTFEEGNSLIV
jgi:hypothetical protein